MDYLGDKLSVAHTQVSGWMGSVRRSFQGALSFVSSSVERRRAEGGGGEEGTGFKRAASLRSLANRSRESFRRFSVRSQQRLSLRRRATPTSPTTPVSQTTPTSPATPSSEQVKPSGQQEAKDTDTLFQETDSQYGTWDTGLHTDESLSPATPSTDDVPTPSPRKHTPAHTPEEPTPADTPSIPSPAVEEPPEPDPFPETHTALLDSSALRSRAQLSKRMSRRAPPSRTARHSAALTLLSEDSAAGGEEWRYRDSTEDKPDSKSPEEEDSDSEEQPRDPRTPVTSSSSSSAPSQPQRVSLFPGMDPSSIMAQLKKRGEADTPDGPSPAPSQPSRSPKSPFLPRAARVLPPAGGKENGEAASPQWLKELKTKKRLSQYENES